jgi:hypothetical protein
MHVGDDRAGMVADRGSAHRAVRLRAHTVSDRWRRSLAVTACALFVLAWAYGIAYVMGAPA